MNCPHTPAGACSFCYEELKLQIGRLEVALTDIADTERSCECSDGELEPEKNNCVHCIANEALSTTSKEKEGESIYCQDPNCSGHCGKLKEW